MRDRLMGASTSARSNLMLDDRTQDCFVGTALGKIQGVINQRRCTIGGNRRAELACPGDRPRTERPPQSGGLATKQCGLTHYQIPCLPQAWQAGGSPCESITGQARTE